LLWTDENWKLAGAKAIAYNPLLNYIIVEHKNENFLVAEKRLGEFVARLGNGKSDSFKIKMVLSGDQLLGMTAQNPLNGHELRLI